MKVAISILMNDKIGVSCPYAPSFVEIAKRLKGVWSLPQKLWVFDAVMLEEVKKALMTVYLTDSGPCERIAIKITATKPLWVTKGPVVSDLAIESVLDHVVLT